MPRPKAVASLATNNESDMDEDTVLPDALPTPESNQENAQPTGKGRGRGKVAINATTMSKPNQKRAGVGATAGKKKVTSTKTGARRGPLKEQSNTRNPEDTEEVDDFDEIGPGEDDKRRAAASADELIAVKQPAKKAPIGAKRKAQPKKKQTNSETLQQIKGTANDGEFEYTPVIARQTKQAKKPLGRLPGSQRVPSENPVSEKVIPDTQDVVMEDRPQNMAFLSDEEEEIPQSVFRRTDNAQSRQRPPAVIHKRPGSASDTEKGIGDSAMRRKLEEMTRKLESMDTRYKALKEIGITQAEANYDKLKAASEAKSKAANELIASLKKELATQKALAQESRTLQNQLANKDIEVSKAQALATELSNNLSEVQNENKVLHAKVASARSASATIESASSRTPGSAIKGRGPARTIMVGSAEAAQAAQTAQLKEDLYRDLTGLLVLGVERGSEADTYDCIQTGRNGTLHFKLSIATNSEDGYDETEFQYTPRLDNDRDRDLLELLPDYLSEEITFSRLNAAKFYGRVVETLTKKRVENDEV